MTYIMWSQEETDREIRHQNSDKNKGRQGVNWLRKQKGMRENKNDLILF